MLMLVFIFTITEYVLLRKMVPFYYKNGPLTITATFKSIFEKDIVVYQLKEKETISIKSLQNSILLFFKPSLKRYFLKEGFLTQRVVLNFSKESLDFKVRCEIRPFYSAFLLPVFTVLFIIFEIILLGQYTDILSKIFEVISACLVSSVIFVVLGPSSDIINRVKKELEDVVKK